MVQGSRNKTLALAFTAAASVGLLAGIGCDGGDTDGGVGSGGAGLGNQYVSDGGAGASLKIISDDTDIPTGDRQGFFVEALDPRGVPLDFIRIMCDSEHGLAILEPSDNGIAAEHTGADGRMSGVLGCITPGSYLLECRAPEPSGLLTRMTFHCRGDVPDGFDGFPGAAGGNIGGGLIVDQTDDGGQILQALFTDAGGQTEFGPIDTAQIADCDATTPEFEPEPFSNTTYTITIQNNSVRDLTITDVALDVDDGQAASVVSQSVNVVIAPGASTTVSGTLINVTAAGGQQYAATGVTGSPVIEGTYSVAITASGEDASGDGVTLSATTTLSFSDLVDNCTS